jgi:hypothetical protein
VPFRISRAKRPDNKPGRTKEVKGMGIFFCFMPLDKGLYRAVSKWCISQQSMESIAKPYIHHFETATRFNYGRA